jgi:hypothetical protein
MLCVVWPLYLTQIHDEVNARKKLEMKKGCRKTPFLIDFGRQLFPLSGLIGERNNGHSQKKTFFNFRLLTINRTPHNSSSIKSLSNNFIRISTESGFIPLRYNLKFLQHSVLPD